MILKNKEGRNVGARHRIASLGCGGRGIMTAIRPSGCFHRDRLGCLPPKEGLRAWGSLIVNFYVCMFNQSCPTLCKPTDYNPPVSSDHGILQARIVEWVAMPSSRGSSQPRDRTQVSCTEGRFCIDWATRDVPANTGSPHTHSPVHSPLTVGDFGGILPVLGYVTADGWRDI